MKSRKRLATVALSGPLRKSFAYHLGDGMPQPELGQRLLVEFGRRRTVGFYLGETEISTGIKTKPIIRTLDSASYFPKQLFDFCLWMADYYFANPADCLAAALPSILKSKMAASLVWSEDDTDLLPDNLKSICQPGQKLGQAAIELIPRTGKHNLRELVATGRVIEQWPEPDQNDPGEKQTIAGYRVINEDQWQPFFEKRKFQPKPFDGLCTSAKLKHDGWSDHFLRLAISSQLLEAIYKRRADKILDFVTPRDDVTGLKLTSGQTGVLHQLLTGLDSGFAGYLLHGITGSGKTLVYCHLAREVLKRDRTVLVLTPEIALSGTSLAYFRGFFGEEVTVIHSAMTSRERLESWNGIRRGEYRIVIGPRSALFAPLEKLGLIIVDEEHDSSYKQDDPSPRFHGRDAAVMRAKIGKVPVLLGSASPSLESYHHTRTGRYRLLELTDRPAGARLPSVKIIDMRSGKLHGDMPYLSFPLKKEVEHHLESDGQVILFLNRRGFSPQLKCADCGHVPACPHCAVKLTYHRVGRKLSCHFCGHLQFSDDICPSCSGSRFLFPGAGTQKVEAHLAQLFKKARVLRFDSDTTSGRKNSHRMLKEFADLQYNLLLGTQMVTKGLDFPGVSLVGVLSADHGLDLPDFRASEKTFARLLQVAGRSGRGAKPGEVSIQTYYPESDIITDAAAGNYTEFFEREIKSRREHNFPPFTRLVRFILSSRDESLLAKAAADFGNNLRRQAQQADPTAEILGPALCPLPFLRANHRRHLFVKTRQTMRLGRMLSTWENGKARFGLPAKVKIVVDVDPDDMM